MKKKVTYVCTTCGVEYPKFQGQCSHCHDWNTLIEEVASVKKSAPVLRDGKRERVQAQRLEDIDEESYIRIETKYKAFNEVLGGGIVPASVILLGGEPGIGKSTLLLQIALSLPSLNVVYVSGEESNAQIKLRAQRLGYTSHKNFYLLSEICLEHILQHLEKCEAHIIIIDSIQTIYSEAFDAAAGSLTQVRHCTFALSNYVKEHRISAFLVGHVNKEGAVAGPKTLEHMVDVVLQFEGDRYGFYRMLRAAKNRFGSTLTLGLYKMQHDGLEEEKNPSQAFISSAWELPNSGRAIGLVVEGRRALLLEVQSLVSHATYSTVQRLATGIDQKRLHMLLALLEKRTELLFRGQDVFINLAGGIKIEDRATDLALCMSVASSLKNRPVPGRTAFAAEVGLGGELRPVGQMDMRLTEARKLGFKEVYISTFQEKVRSSKDLTIHTIKYVDELYKKLF